MILSACVGTKMPWLGVPARSPRVGASPFVQNSWRDLEGFY